MTAPTDPIRVNQIALAGTDPNKFQLMKKLAQDIQKATPVDKRFKPAKKSCKHCYGRGFVGYLNGLKSLPVPCRCTFVKTKMGLDRPFEDHKIEEKNPVHNGDTEAV